MELKFRRKGEVITVGGFPADSLPREILPSDDHESIDLTGYPVIYVTAGRGGRDKAAGVAANAPNCIVAYKYEWRNGWVECVFLSSNFNASRVQHYKTAGQLEAGNLTKSLHSEAITHCLAQIRNQLDNHMTCIKIV